MHINEIERLPDRAARIAAYRRYVEEHSGRAVAWFNLAVTLEEDRQYDEAVRTAHHLRMLSAALYAMLPRRLLTLAGERLPEPERGAADGEIGPYKVLRIAHAGEAELLYDGVRVADGEPVTLRACPDLSADAARRRLEAEREAAIDVRGLARPLAVVDDRAGTPHMVLERVRGTPLVRFGTDGQVDADVAVKLTRAVARVVRRLHERGRVAADLRPEIILRQEDVAADEEDVVLLGARRAGQALPSGWGRLGWLSPEERADAAPGERTDIYALGRLLHGLATGSREPPPATGPLVAGWPALDKLIRRATADDPAARHASADELLRELDQVLGERMMPSRIGKWRLGEVLGEGTFGRVYAATNADLPDLRAAVKVLHPYMAHEPEMRRRFLNEATAASRVDHPGIVKIFDGGVTDDGICYLSMEQVEAPTLVEVMAAGPLPPARAALIGAHIAEALAAAHDAGIVHRDLKPGNIFVLPGDRTKVLDFGVAKLRGEPTAGGQPMTSTGRLLGTPEYMAPEQWQTLPDLDGRVDIYALGVLLHECLTGRKPFTGTTQYELQQAHLSAQPPPLQAGPPALRALIERMLSKSRDQRPQSMTEVAAALRRAAAEGTPAAPTDDDRDRKRRLLWVGLAAGVVATAAIAVIALRGSGDGGGTGPKPPPDARPALADASPPDATPVPDASPPDARPARPDAGPLPDICDRECLRRCGISVICRRRCCRLDPLCRLRPDRCATLRRCVERGICDSIPELDRDIRDMLRVPVVPDP